MNPEDEAGIKVTGLTEDIKPLKRFEDLVFHGSFKQLMDRQNWRAPTHIQAYAIPIILKDKSVIGVSATGSGKTLAYVLPLSYIMTSIPNVKTLVLAPTRQLCKQIATEFDKLLPRDVGCVYGGVHKSLQVKDLFRKVLVATPGRLTDFMRSNKLKFDFIVIDEADRILQGNFIDQLNEILKGVGPYQRLHTFTATITREVSTLIHKYIKDPVRITIGGSNTFNANITQEIIPLRNFKEKVEEMIEILRDFRGYKVLIFTNTKSKTQELSIEIKERLRQRAIFISGDLPQDRREMFISQFREGRTNVLVATDVASRGLDINNISLVLNFDFPKDIQTYTHRIGRTARYNKKGTAISFLQREPPRLQYELVEFMVKCRQKVPQFLLNSSGFPQRKIRELEEYFKSQELPPDMPPPPPPPERVKEEEYVEGSTMIESNDRYVREQQQNDRREPIVSPFSKVKPMNAFEERRILPKSLTSESSQPFNSRKKENDGMEFGYNEPVVELNEDLNMSFQHYNIPADLQQSFLNLSFQKVEEQSFIESSRIHTDKNSILMNGIKSQRFDLNNYKPRNVTMSLKYGDQTFTVEYGKFQEHEDEVLVVGRHSAAYTKIAGMVRSCPTETSRTNMQRALEVAFYLIQQIEISLKNLGIGTQSLQVLDTYRSIIFLNPLRIKKELLWAPIFKEFASREVESATVAISLQGVNGESGLETEEEIDFTLTQCITYLTEQQELKRVRLLIDNQIRCKRFLEKAMRMKLL